MTLEELIEDTKNNVLFCNDEYSAEVWKYLEEYKELKNSEDKCVDLVYDLLKEYDMGVWEDIEYIKLADFWVRTIRLSSYADLEKEWPIKERLRNFLRRNE